MNIKINVKKTIQKELDVNYLKIAFQDITFVLKDGSEICVEPENAKFNKCLGIAELKNGELKIHTNLEIIKNSIT